MVTNSISPDALGGLDRYARELSAALVRHGMAVDVITKRNDPAHPAFEVGDDGVRIHRYSLPRRTHPSYAPAYATAPWQAVSRHLAANPDAAVHGHFSVQALPVTFLKRPFVFSFQSPAHKEVLEERRFPLARPLQAGVVRTVRAIERRVVEHAFRNVTLSEFMRTQLAELSPRAADEALVLPGAVDVTHFTLGEGIDHPWADHSGPLLFTARRFVPRTGVVELVQAMPAVLEGRPDARLAIAGTGPLELQVRERIETLGLGDRVQLLGRIPEDALLRWYRSATLVVMPTQELEGFGLTAAEALACGTPVVSTPAGSLPEVVGLLDPALVAASTSPADLASKIVEVLGRDAYLAGLAKRARAAVDPRLGWDVTAEAFLDLYRQLPLGR